ncbi:Bromodomain containing protein [Plasmodiophora brassicae]
MDGHGGGADATADQNSVLDDARSSAPLFPKISPATPASSSVFGGPASLATPMVIEHHGVMNGTQIPIVTVERTTSSNDDGTLPVTDVLFSKFARRSQVERVLSRLMKESVTNSLDWKSIAVRRQKAKRIRTSSSKPKPFISVKKFKITVKKSVIKRKSQSDSKAEANPVSTLLSVQQSEQHARDQARKTQLLELVERLKKRDKYKFFHQPVDVTKVTDYLEVIERPMDLSTVKKNVLLQRYQNLDEFRADVDLIFYNCLKYNHPETLYAQQAESMLLYVERTVAEAKRVFEPEETPPLIHPYETLDESVMAVDEETVRRKLASSKRGQCDGQYCLRLEDVGAYDVNKAHFESLAPDRSNMTECSDDCLCDPAECLNRGVSLNRGKKLNVDIDKRNVYGIDSHTHKLIKTALTNVIPSDADATGFIESKILRYINMHAMASDAELANDTTSYERAQSLIQSIKSGLSLPVYDKGHGVICLNRNGFKKNDFIVEYVGEVYPPWRWFEKQAVLKQFQKVYMTPFSFGFYNILLERHRDDGLGYDVLYLDACRKGNYASRLSHSCSPNCTSVCVAANGRFAIIVIALRDIAPNEELTFDYHSVTESPEEAKNAVCFCGWSICRGRYVQFAGPDQFQQVLNVHHGFTQRTSLLLRACVEPLSSSDRGRLQKWHFMGSVLDGLPEWAVKFASLILEYIEFEKSALPKELMQLSKFAYTKEAAELDTLGVIESRLQCLSIALDKVKYVLRESGGITEPPLRLLTPDEVIDRIWNAEDSVIASAAKKIAPLLDDVDLVRLVECTNYKVQSRREMVSRLIEFRDLLRSMQPSTSCFHHVAADIVHLYAYTDTFYCMTNYPLVKSPPVHFSELGLNITNPDDESLLTPKPYTQAFIWGCLLLWFKQSIDKPDAAAHNAKRGSVCLPSLEGCYSTSRNSNELVEKYTQAQRDAMIACLQAGGAGVIPRHPIWDYRSTNDRVYGSPMLDAVYKKKDLKPLIRGLQAWQPPVDSDGAFEIVQSPPRRRRRMGRA